MPNAITQTADGYIWIGTGSGLVRFDGVRFQPWTDSTAGSQSTFSVYSLLATNDGSLWIGTDLNLDRLRDGVLTTIGGSGTVGMIHAIAQDPSGNIWLARTDNSTGGALCELKGNTLRCLDKSDGLECMHGEALTNDSSDGMWVAGRQICHWSRSATKNLIVNTDHIDDEEVTSIVRHKDGSMLLGIAGEPPDKPGILTVDSSGSRLGNSESVETLSRGLQVTTLLPAHDGSLWVGTTAQGIYHVTANSLDHYGASDGLSGGSVTGLYQDREESIWVSTAGGVDRFHIPKVLFFTTREGLVSDYIYSVLGTKDGSVFIGTEDGLSIFNKGSFSSVQIANGLPGRQIRSMHADRLGRIWLSTVSDLVFYERGRFNIVRDKDGSSLREGRSIVEDTNGTIWVVANLHLYQINGRVAQMVPMDGQVVDVVADPKDGVWLTFWNQFILYRYRVGDLQKVTTPPNHRNFLTFSVDPDGSLWVPSFYGLMHWDKNGWSTLDEEHGLPCSSVTETLRDLANNLWLMTGCGVVRISDAEMKKWILNRDYKVSARSFDNFDGARSLQAFFNPPANRSADGRLWFAGENGLQVVDPNNLPRNEVIPPVHIERLLADGAKVQSGNGVELGPGTRDIEIRYTALSLVIPQRVRFRYRLIGFDKGWVDVGTRREAFYQNLSPGHYTFQVIASNDDGLWNTVGDSFQFRVLPTFYQTGWFRFLIGVIVLAAILALIRLRELMTAVRIEGQMGERLLERDRIARELHDTLLQGFHGVLLRFQVASDAIPPGGTAKEIMADTMNRADAVLKEGRERVRDLRSTEDHISLEDELRMFVDQENLDSTAVCTLEVFGVSVDLHPVVRDEIYAIAKEAILNAIQHSGAKDINCELSFSKGHCKCSCKDNGTGIAPDILQAGGKQGHWGLVGMRERALKIGAEFSVLARQGGGTSVEVVISSRLAYRKANTTPGLISKIHRWRSAITNRNEKR